MMTSENRLASACAVSVRQMAIQHDRFYAVVCMLVGSKNVHNIFEIVDLIMAKMK